MEKIIINKKLEEELEIQFPKGDKLRGKALVLFAIAQIELNKLEAKRKYWKEKFKKEEQKLKELQEAYNIAMKEIARLRNKLGYDKK